MVSCSVSVASCSGHWINCQSTRSIDIEQKAKILEYSQLSTHSIDIGQKAKILEYSQLSTCSIDIGQKDKILEYSQLLSVCDVLLLAVLNGQLTTSAQNANMAMYCISASSSSGCQINLTQAYTQCSSHIKVKGKRQE